VGGEIAPSAGLTGWYYTPGTALDLDGHLLYVQSHTNAIQNGWKESTLSDSSHMLYMNDGTNELGLCQAGNDRDVFKHAKTQVQFQSFVIDLDYLATKNTNGEVYVFAGSVASFVKTSVDDVGSAFHTESKALGGGQNCFIDIMRYDQTDASGNSTTSNSGIFIYGGTTGDRGTFAEIVADDESITADKAFGVIREYTTGSYGLQGILKFGTTNALSNAYFQDSDFTLTVENRDINDDKLKLYVFGNSTDTNDFRLSNGTIASAGPGLEINMSSNDIDVIDLNNVTFKDLKRAVTFPTDSASYTHAVENSTFDNCGTVTVGTVDFDNNSIINSAATTNAVILGYNVTALNMIVSGYEGTANTSALQYTPNEDPDGNIDGSSFTKGTAATHAIEFGTSTPLNMTLRNIAFSGYNATHAQNDSTLHIKRTSGTVTITLIGCTGNISYRTDGATVKLIINPVTVAIHTQKKTDQSNLAEVQVGIKKATPSEYTSASGNSQGDTDFVVTEALASDTMTEGWIDVYDLTNDNQHSYRYSSYDSGTKTFSLRTKVTGTCEAGGSATVLNDTGIGAMDVKEGDTFSKLNNNKCSTRGDFEHMGY
jgi:hypothetical protein